MKYLKAIASIIAFLLCSNAFIMTAQNEFGGIIRFDKTVHDFGDILISDGEQKCTFTFTNIGKQPIVVSRVISSCGCTEPKWTQSPVRPGEKGTINVVFKNDQGPYPFDKSITTYVYGLEKPVMLRIRGIANEKKKSLKEIFSDSFGQLGMRDDTLELGHIEQGLARNESVEVANLSSKSIKVEFADLTEGLSISISPNPIPPKSKSTITYSVDSDKMSPKGWGKSDFTASVVVNGVKQSGKIVVETLIRDNFSSYTVEDKARAALPFFDTSNKNIGECRKGEKKSLSFVCTNKGKEPLVLHNVYSLERGVTVKYPNEIAPGKKGTVVVTIDTGKNTGEILYILTAITNSPQRPILNLFITGTIK